MTALATQARPQGTGPVSEEALSRSLQQQFGLSVKWQSEGRFPATGQSYRLTTGAMVTGSPEAKRQALTMLETSSRAASPDATIQALGEMAAITARKADGDDPNALTLAALASRLSAYPADVAMTAVRRWPDTNKWFPTWAELREQCERLMAPRRFLEASLRMEAAKPAEPVTRTEQVKSGLRDLARKLSA